MTPREYYTYATGNARVDFVYRRGGYVYYYLVHGNAAAVRPVISLKADAIGGGDGTVGNPFYVNEAYGS